MRTLSKRAGLLAAFGMLIAAGGTVAALSNVASNDEVSVVAEQDPAVEGAVSPARTGSSQARAGSDEQVNLATRTPSGVTDNATSVPDPPATLEAVAARIECPRTGDPNGPSNLAYVTGNPAPGTGEVTPEAALQEYLDYAWPLVDRRSFAVTARNSGKVLFENRHAALVVTMVEPGRWSVMSEVFCAPITAQWRGRRP